MDRICRPNDDFRERLTRDDIARICSRHRLAKPERIISEGRGNEKVIYHLDGCFSLAFCLSDDIRANVETLTILEHVGPMPTPRVVAWAEQDANLGVPYMITERCPGTRLDELWRVTGFRQRVALLESLGEGMAAYHTVSAADLQKLAVRLSLGRRVHDATALPAAEDTAHADGLERALRRVAAGLVKLGVEASQTMRLLQAHMCDWLPQDRSPLIGPGLVHDEPWAEHFLLRAAQQHFRLSGCVDLESVLVADSVGEIVVVYVSMLALHPQYYGAFRRGYERFFPFPEDAEERLRTYAVEFDLDAVTFLIDQMDRSSDWHACAAAWGPAHWRRLEGWLDPAKRTNEALFRADIGPY